MARTILFAPLCLNRSMDTPGKRDAWLPGACHSLQKPLCRCRDADCWNKYKQLILHYQFLLWGKKTSYGFLFRFFCITRCLIFGYFFLMLSIAIGCSRCSFLSVLCWRKWSLIFFFFLLNSNLNRREYVSYVSIY